MAIGVRWLEIDYQSNDRPCLMLLTNDSLPPNFDQAGNFSMRMRDNSPTHQSQYHPVVPDKAGKFA